MRARTIGLVVPSALAGALPFVVDAVPADAQPRGHSCQVTARITRLSNTSYNIGGTASCDEQVASLTLTCKPVHKHTIGWHSHDSITFPAGSNTKEISWDAGPIGGTNGDSYKTSCTATGTNHGSSSTDTDESFTINL